MLMPLEFFNYYRHFALCLEKCRAWLFSPAYRIDRKRGDSVVWLALVAVPVNSKKVRELCMWLLSAKGVVLSQELDQTPEDNQGSRVGHAA